MAVCCFSTFIMYLFLSFRIASNVGLFDFTLKRRLHPFTSGPCRSMVSLTLRSPLAADRNRRLDPSQRVRLPQHETFNFVWLGFARPHPFRCAALFGHRPMFTPTITSFSFSFLVLFQTILLIRRTRFCNIIQGTDCCRLPVQHPFFLFDSFCRQHPLLLTSRFAPTRLCFVTETLVFLLTLHRGSINRHHLQYHHLHCT